MTRKQIRRDGAGREAVRSAEAPRRRGRGTADLPVADTPGAAGTDEVRSVVMHLARRVDELTGELDRARRRVAELETETDEDAVLPVLNRRGFLRELARTISFIDRYEVTVSLVRLDVAGMAAINDGFGHGAGDAVLGAVAGRISRAVRASDLVGRLGGNAFGVILWTAGEADAARKAASLLEVVSTEDVPVDGLDIGVCAIAGATALVSGDTVEVALGRAEAAMATAPRPKA